MDSRRRNSTRRRAERPRPPQKPARSTPSSLPPSNDPAAAALHREQDRLRPAIGALRQIHCQLDVANSVVSLCAAVLRAQMADYDSDLAAVLTHCVGSVLDVQMARLHTLFEGGAS